MSDVMEPETTEGARIIIKNLSQALRAAHRELELSNSTMKTQSLEIKNSLKLIEDLNSEISNYKKLASDNYAYIKSVFDFLKNPDSTNISADKIVKQVLLELKTTNESADDLYNDISNFYDELLDMNKK